MNIEFPLINAVIQKKQQGQIFELNGSRFVIHKSGFSYLDLKQGENINTILDFFANESSLPVYFHIYNPPTDFVEKINTDERFGTKY